MKKTLNIEAIKLMQENKFEEAYDAFSKLIEENPKNYEAIYFRSIVDFGHLKKYFPATLSDFNYLSSFKNPYQIPSIQLVTIMYDMDDEYDMVIEKGKVALELLEKNNNSPVDLKIDIYYALARAYFHKYSNSDLAKALIYIEHVFEELKEDADLEYYLLKVDILIGLKKYDIAKSVIAKAQANFGNAGDLYYAKEKLSYAIGLDKISKGDESYVNDLEDAIRYLDIFSNYTDNAFVIALTRVEIFTALKRYDDAIGILDTLITKENVVEIMIEKIKVYENSGNIDAAIKLCEEYLANNDSWKIKYSLGYLLLSKGDSIENINQCLSLQYDAYKDSKESFILYEICFLNNKLFRYEENYDLLKEHYRAGIPDSDGKGAYLLAVMAQAIGRSYDEQVEYYHEAFLRNYIDEIEYLDEIAGLVDDPSKLTKLILKHQADKIEDLDPWSKRKIGIRYLYGENGYKQDFDKAKVYLELAFKELEDKACMCSTMGKFFEFKQDFNNAFKHYNEAFKIYNNQPFNPCNCSVGYLAHCYYKGIGVEKDTKKAKDLVLSGIYSMGKNASNSVIYLYAYFALNGEKDFDLALAKELLSSTHTFDRYEISKFVMLKQINNKLNINDKDLDLMIKRCLKFITKEAKLYYKENIKQEVSYPYFRDF